ncbi:hypothetical protein [Staphylococcus phage PT1-4]
MLATGLCSLGSIKFTMMCSLARRPATRNISLTYMSTLRSIESEIFAEEEARPRSSSLSRTRLLV